MPIKLDLRGRRSLTIAVVVALGFGLFMLFPFFTVIALSTIAAYIFFPLYKWLLRKTRKAGIAAALTTIATLLVVVIPFTLVALATFQEVQNAIKLLSAYTAANDLGQIGNTAVVKINELLATFTNGLVTLDITQVKDFVTSSAAKVADFGVKLLTSSAGSVGAFFIALILYLYIFTTLLINNETIVRTIKGLNPLGNEISDIYLRQAGAMTKAMVRGQFIIAVVQGLIGAAILYFVGIDMFWLLFLALTLLSFIPLGAGIVTIPIGIVYLITGNIAQGLVVLLGHFFIISNIDNFLRPMLVPKDARLNPALTILSVFAGVGLFGLLGIVIGPVIMILIVTTVKLYLAQLDTEKLATAAANKKKLHKKSA
jgi:predicted PurR-regulated permease PerM